MTYSKLTILAVVATVVSLASLSSCTLTSEKVSTDSTIIDTTKIVVVDSIVDSVVVVK